MGSKAPPVPKAQRSAMGRGASPPDQATRDPAGGNANLHLKEQGRLGARRQNMVHAQRSGDR